jgi:hypothetical protein
MGSLASSYIGIAGSLGTWFLLTALLEDIIIISVFWGLFKTGTEKHQIEIQICIFIIFVILKITRLIDGVV